MFTFQIQSRPIPNLYLTRKKGVLDYLDTCATNAGFAGASLEPIVIVAPNQSENLAAAVGFTAADYSLLVIVGQPAADSAKCESEGFTAADYSLLVIVGQPAADSAKCESEGFTEVAYEQTVIPAQNIGESCNTTANGFSQISYELN